MNIQRRTFLQALGALGISIAAPQAVTKTLGDFNVVCDKPAREQGTYALLAFHREWVAHRSLFHRVPFVECKRVVDEHGVVEGDHVWVKLPLIARPNPYLEELPGRDDYFVPGGMAMRYSASKIVYAHNGDAFRVVKNRVSGLHKREIVLPEVLHTTKVAMLHPFNNMFAGPDVPGEIMIM